MTSMFIFTHDQRVHDNEPLAMCVRNASILYPVYVYDINHDMSPVRLRFIQQSLDDLNANLLEYVGVSLITLPTRDVSTRLKTVKTFIKKHSVTTVGISKGPGDTNSTQFISNLQNWCLKLGSVHLHSYSTHTLYDPADLRKDGDKMYYTYNAFNRHLETIGDPPTPSTTQLQRRRLQPHSYIYTFKIPHNTTNPLNQKAIVVGGETAGLQRLNNVLKDVEFVINFNKPKTNPFETTQQTSTTLLSPYLAVGNVSVRLVYYRLNALYIKNGVRTRSQTSLLGQLLWREFFHYNAYHTPNYDHIQGNPICRAIPWSYDDELVTRFKHARTGFPIVDACLVQLYTEGWIHHLARHLLACFFTRGDLFQDWTIGAEIFNRHLLDADWCVNTGNWLWLSSSAYFYRYHHIYSPITFAIKYDKRGVYVRKYLPELSRVPDNFIYSPWKMPVDIQRNVKCVVGVDYPAPIVEHDVASKRNILTIKSFLTSTRLSKIGVI